MRIIFLLICTVTLLATSGCIFRGGGGDRGHWDHDDHGGEHHDDDHH